MLTGIWFDALYAAQQEFAENSIEAALGIRDGFYVSQGRLLRRVEQIMEAWKENKEARKIMENKEAWKDHEQRFCNFRGATSL